MSTTSSGVSSSGGVRRIVYLILLAAFLIGLMFAIAAPTWQTPDKPYPGSRVYVGKTLLPGNLDVSTYVTVSNFEIGKRLFNATGRFASSGNPVVFIAAFLVLLMVISLLLASLLCEKEA